MPASTSPENSGFLMGLAGSGPRDGCFMTFHISKMGSTRPYFVPFPNSIYGSPKWVMILSIYQGESKKKYNSECCLEPTDYRLLFLA